MSKAANDNLKLIVRNRRATFEYHVERRLEAGIELRGSEVKSLRDGQVNLSDSYAAPHRGELFLLNCNIAPYKSAPEGLNHEPLRKRKLLLNRREIDELERDVTLKGLTLIPLSLYFKDGRVKLELGLCKGKTHGDKRDAIAEREGKREVDRAMRAGRQGRGRGD